MTPLFWGVVWPMSKILSRRWPLMVTRGLTRALGTFPKYEPSAADVFICSYFKSGTNWTMHIALQIAFRGGARFEHVHDLVAWPETPLRSARYRLPNPPRSTTVGRAPRARRAYE